MYKCHPSTHFHLNNRLSSTNDSNSTHTYHVYLIVEKRFRKYFYLEVMELFGTWGLGGIFRTGRWLSSNDCYSYLKSNVRQSTDPMLWVGSWGITICFRLSPSMRSSLVRIDDNFPYASVWIRKVPRDVCFFTLLEGWFWWRRILGTKGSLLELVFPLLGYGWEHGAYFITLRISHGVIGEYF